MNGRRAKALRRQAQAEVPQPPRVVELLLGKRIMLVPREPAEPGAPIELLPDGRPAFDEVEVECRQIMISGWPRRYEELKKAHVTRNHA